MLWLSSVGHEMRWAKIQGPTGVMEEWREGLEYKTEYIYVFLGKGPELPLESVAQRVLRSGPQRLFQLGNCTAPRSPNPDRIFPFGSRQVEIHRSGERGDQVASRVLLGWARVSFTCSQALACGLPSVPTLGEHGPDSHHGRRHVGRTTTLSIVAATDTDRR